jgi:hypothetical protein
VLGFPDDRDLLSFNPDGLRRATTTMLAAAHRRACRRATAVTYVIPPIAEELCTAANGREAPLNDIR